MSLVEISIFTPTYNRAGILKACYDSLLKQTSKNFVWIIVDDGSTDETEALIKEWQKGDSISILYLKQGNSGKHVAHNNAVKVCTTPYILILDSDDTLTPDCIETLYRYLPKLSSDGISGIIGNRYKNTDGKCHGTIMPSGLEYASGIELYQTHGVTGDTLRLYKTSVLREFLLLLMYQLKSHDTGQNLMIYNIHNLSNRRPLNNESNYER